MKLLDLRASLLFTLLVPLVHLQVFAALYVRHYGMQRTRLPNRSFAAYEPRHAWTGPGLAGLLERVRLGRIIGAKLSEVLGQQVGVGLREARMLVTLDRLGAPAELVPERLRLGRGEAGGGLSGRGCDR